MKNAQALLTLDETSVIVGDDSCNKKEEKKEEWKWNTNNERK